MARLVAALVTAAALAGCADSGDERLSREEYVEQATAICTRAEEQIGALEEPGTVAELGDYASEAAAITEAAVADLRGLAPPEELEPGFRRYLESGDRVVALLGELQEAAEAEDEAEARRVAERIAESADVEEAARAAGIPACESSGGG